jgi:hypothetical protein
MFTRPLGSLISNSTVVPHSWAISNRVPASIDSPTSTFNKHSNYSTFLLSLEVPAANNNTTSDSVNTDPNIALSSFCSPGNLLCVSAIANKSSQIATFTVTSSSSGYVGFGIGSNVMVGATMYVAWLGTSNQVVVSQRSASGRTQPTILNDNTGYTILPTTLSSADPKVSSARIVYSFSKSIASDSGKISLESATNFIWAMGSSQPANPDSPSSTFSYHELSGSFSMDLSKFGTSSSEAAVASSYGTNTKALRIVHGVSMFLAWGVLPYAAIYIARYLKDAWGHRWFQAHMALMLYGVGALVIIGIVTIEVSIPEGTPRLVTNYHGIMGTTIALAGFPCQVILGIVSDKLWTAERKEIPVWDKVHWWLGRSLVILAGVNFYFGLELAGAEVWAYAVVYVIVALGFGSLIVGQIRGGAVHHVGGHGKLDAENNASDLQKS